MANRLAAVAAPMLTVVALAVMPVVAEEPKLERSVVISAAAAASHGLPPVGVRLDLTGTVLVPRPCPAPGCYLALSGPPGGPLSATVDAWSDPARDAAALERAVRASFADQGLVVDRPVELSLGSRSVAGLAFFTGRGHAHTGCVAAIVPAGEGRAVLLTIGVGLPEGAGRVPLEEVAGHRDLARVLATLVVD